MKAAGQTILPLMPLPSPIAGSTPFVSTPWIAALSTFNPAPPPHFIRSSFVKDPQHQRGKILGGLTVSPRRQHFFGPPVIARRGEVLGNEVIKTSTPNPPGNREHDHLELLKDHVLLSPSILHRQGRTRTDPGGLHGVGSGGGGGSADATAKAALQNISRRYQRRIAVAVENVNNRTSFRYHENTPFRPASVIKLFILNALLERAMHDRDFLGRRVTFVPARHVTTRGTGVLQQEKHSRRYSISDYMRLMIEHSDNIATNILIAELGMQYINRQIQASGFVETTLQRRMYGFAIPPGVKENSSTADDVVRLLIGIAQEAHKKDIFFQLLRKADERKLLQNGVPPPAKVLTKSGILEGAYHEAGYIIRPNALYAVAVFTEGRPMEDETVLAQLFAEIGQVVHFITIQK